ncbi:MAG: MCP four helix bundle domain-containing protein, partial [Oscillospiraceae bacterium]
MLRNMKISKKLILTFILVALLSSIAGIAGLVLLNKSDGDYSTALVENGFVLGDIGDYNAYLNKGGAVVRDIIMLTDPAQIQAAQAELKTAKQLTQEALDKVKATCKTPAELELLAKIDAAAPLFQEARDRAVALGLHNQNDEALRVFHEEARPYLVECTDAGQDLMALNVELGATVSGNLTSQSRFAILVMTILMLAATVIAFTLALLVSRSIAKPISACAQRLTLLSQGDLTTPVPDIHAKDETGVLADATRVIVGALNAIITDTDYLLSEMANGNFDVHSKENEKYIGDFAPMLDSMRKINSGLSDTLSQINQA